MAEKNEPLTAPLKRLLFGAPLRTAQQIHQRLSNPVALAVFASDALSSTAYATEEILHVLTLAGAGFVSLVLPLSACIVGLIAIVTLSYRQTIHAYPGGGGAYIVATENLGSTAGTVAGASLLIDYILTVAVSVAAGIAALVSAIPELQHYRVLLCLLVVAFITLANLRGVKESGALFAVPTYGFVLMMLGMLLVAAYRYAQGDITPVIYPPNHLSEGHAGHAVVGLTALLLLRSFSSGCAALTGIEAVSNGVTAFRQPEADNASVVLVWMSALLGIIFLGISFFTIQYQLLPYGTEQAGYQTLVSQLAEQVFGGRNLGYFGVQAFTSLILLLAANTAYADFPRLASLIAKDGFLPRQFMTLGDKLVFANGIVILAALSGLLLVLFRGDTHALIPLYAVGVFLSFTLSQTGMVVHWFREPGPRRWGSILINGVGALLTFIVLLIIGITKFHPTIEADEKFYLQPGAWIVIVLIPMIVALFRAIKGHYAEVAEQLSLEGREVPVSDPHKVHHTVIIPIGGIQYSVVKALQYAQSLSADDVRAVYVNINPTMTAKLEERWPDWGLGVTLVVLESPFRSILEPLLAYLDMAADEQGVDFITVLLPEFVTAHWWEGLLHNQTAVMIRTYLGFKKNVVVTSVRHFLED